MDWNIERGPRQCACCNASFQPGEEYYSVLVDTGKEFARQDHCVRCWDAAPDHPEAFCHWKTRVPEKHEQPRLLADDDVLWDLFLRLQDDPDPGRQSFCYLMALILMRRKILKFDVVEREAEREFLILRQPKETRRFRVLNPRLTEEQLEQVKQQMGQILDLSL